MIGEAFYNRLGQTHFDVIGGMQTASIPLITAIVQRFLYKEGFWIIKNHGTKKLIEGNLKSKSRVIVIDDVATTGESILKAIKIVELLGDKSYVSC